ncbi:MAG TPA: ABC transporter substrate-binding protein [Thermoanaerobaculia bacterium]|nr:ABC transporter substrate-binding protein [Thermoanaerobaculia bacterium]
MLALLVAAGSAGCGQGRAGRDGSTGASATANGGDCEDPLARVEIAPADRAVTRYARNFRIEYDGRRKRVTVENPWRNTDLALTHLLVPCGDPQPAATAGQTIVRVPVSRAATTSTTELSHFTALGIVDRLAGHNRLDYVWEPEIRQRIDAGQVAEIGDSVRLDLEALLELRPDLVLATSIGNPELDVFSMLERAGLPYAVDAAWTEATPLGRAEWIKFTAAFFNQEVEANRLFDRIAARYEELRAIAQTIERRPTVLVGTPFQGTWHVSGGAAYQARLIADAGGAYLWADDPTTGSIPLDFESVYARGLDAEVWIHPYGWHSLADGIKADERMADFAAWKSGRVYNNDARINARGGNDYWETGSLRPDLILADLIEVLHPGLIDHQLVFHRQLPQGESP